LIRLVTTRASENHSIEQDVYMVGLGFGVGSKSVSGDHKDLGYYRMPSATYMCIIKYMSWT
jgi:hypothetical protein